ncbi:DsbA family protein [Vagococcus silagei]|uniref:DsbA family protein n=1 Tax=Vagococcus silagei TaxID=2508885 RepID=A0A4S3B7G3_9ENTE|nr:DsbA family protein [Vagococcus silagei]THB62417.1 DsbA family protein [Vagococcus silagei]
MIEIYLFVNPLDKHCLDIEKKFLNIINNESQKIHFRVIPIINLKIIHQFLKRKNLESKGLEYRNELFTSIYSACLDLKAAQLQGMHMSKKLLLLLQEAVGVGDIPYSPELALHLIQKIGADVETFKEDRDSKLVQRCFQKDQQIAQEMSVSDYSTAVIFNYDSHEDFGILVDANLSERHISRLIQASSTSNLATNRFGKSTLPEEFYFN